MSFNSTKRLGGVVIGDPAPNSSNGNATSSSGTGNSISHFIPAGRNGASKLILLMGILFIPLLYHQYGSITKQFSTYEQSSVKLATTSNTSDSQTSQWSNLRQYSNNKPDSNAVCFSWEEQEEADAWWAVNPTYIASSQDLETGVCFSPLPPSAKSYFFQQVWDNQYLNTTNSKNGSMENDASNRCSKVHTRHMWSSGWGADFTNVAHGLMYGLENQVPFQVTFQYENEMWHYAAFKEEYRDGRPPVCPSADMFCYFLPLTPCPPCSIEELNTDPPFPDTLESGYQFWEGQYNAWLVEYANRPKMWLRRKVLQYMQDHAPHPIEKPCAAIHVRRTDVILHGESSRQYFAIEDYLNTLQNAGGKHRNILLFTDDANAVEEALELHPTYHWMLIDKPRHKGSSGGWENQVPSDDPSEEVAAILTEMKLAQECDTLVFGDSGYARLLWDSMVNGGERVVSLRVDNGKRIESEEYQKSEELLKKRLELAKQKNSLEEGSNRDGDEDAAKRSESHNYQIAKRREGVKYVKAEAVPRDDNGETNDVEGEGNDEDNQSDEGNSPGDVGDANGCASQKGLIVLNLLGRLGNNMFEFGFASMLAKELCWGVVYRTAWASSFLEDGGKECFPKAILPPTEFNEDEMNELHLDGNHPDLLVPRDQDAYDVWLKDREAENIVATLDNLDFDATEEYTKTSVRKLKKNDSPFRILNLNGFFIHDWWMSQSTLLHIRHELAPSSECCKTIPNDDVVVIHLREFELEPDEPWVSVKSGFYIQLFEHYDLTNRPIWIVTQPKSVESTLVKELQEALPDVFITVGDDQYDAFCILTKAKTLVMSHKSTFTQSAALIASPSIDVHYPIFDMTPFLTLGFESWNYHLVNSDHDGIVEFDVPLDRLTMRYEIGYNIQIDQVGRGSHENGTIVIH